MAGREFLHLPGPTNIPDAVLEAFRRPAIDFASTEFIDLAEGLWTDLLDVFGGADEVVVLTSVGHGAWESALTNIAEPGDTLLMGVSGMFGQRWAEMAETLGYDVIKTTTELRRPTDPAELADKLTQDRQGPNKIKVVCVTHTETSTGSLADLIAIRAAIDAADRPALFVVDAVCSFATDPVYMRDTGIDVLVVASQKGFMLPPGLAFCALSSKAVEHSKSITPSNHHFAWAPRFQEGHIYYRFGGTPPEQHLFALRASLDLIADEGGIDAVTDRHRRLANAAHAAVEGWATAGPWEINIVDPAERCAAVTCVRTGDLIAKELIETARDRFCVTIAPGIIPSLDIHAIRIGHLGDLNEPMLLGALGGLETAMTTLGMPHGDGVPRAIESLAAL